MTGGCHCGKVRFEVSGIPSWVGICYCLDCRKISGTPAMIFAEFEKGAFKIVRGEPKQYRSSGKVTRTFCGDCGSPLGYAHADYSQVEIPVGAFDDLESFRPEVHIWTSRKPSWVTIQDSLPQREN